jgi:acyl-coenzyme A synthetase/AMP-(fatty) acid ligase
MKRFLLWDYPRAGWQYDVMVVLILAFIFATPRSVFRDQPRASNIVRLPEENGANVFFMEPELISSLPEPERNSKVESLLKSRFGKKETVVRLLPIFDAEDEVKGYFAYTRSQ